MPRFSGVLHHIRLCLPALKSRINGMLSQFHSIVSSLGEGIEDKPRFLLQVITKFANHYCSTIEGTAKIIETSELTGGARICYIFHEVFGKTLEAVNPLVGLRKLDILTAIRNSTGPRPALFVPEVSFELLVKRQIHLLKEPSIRCVELVHDELQRVVQHCGLQQYSYRFPTLHDQIVDVVTNLLKRRLPTTIEMVENLILIELAYINTKHPDFHEANLIHKAILGTGAINREARHSRPNGVQNRTSIRAIGERGELENMEQNVNHGSDNVEQQQSTNYSSIPDVNSMMGTVSGQFEPVEFTGQDTDAITVDSRSLSNRERKECEVIERLISSYFAIVRKSIQDSVPKAIMHFLVNEIKDNLQSELVSALYKMESLNGLLVESPHIADQRADALKMLEALQKANFIINEIREAPLLR
ncbi:hypothetical protein ACOME3_007754 [Neoechinorhynchus agilis]